MVRRQRVQRQVTARTMKRRAQHREEVQAKIAEAKRRSIEPETVAQARVWDRKNKRYLIAGLCTRCAAQAAWGHAMGFQKIHDPCDECLPLVALFDTPGPRGSKWRKCLIKLEYLPADEVAAILEGASA